MPWPRRWVKKGPKPPCAITRRATRSISWHGVSLTDQRALFGGFDDAQPIGDRGGIREFPAKGLREPQGDGVGGGRFQRHGPRAEPHLPDRLPHPAVGVVLLLPAAGGGHHAVLPDPLDLEAGADDRGVAPGGEEQRDQPLAAAGVVAREVLVVRPRRGNG